MTDFTKCLLTHAYCNILTPNNIPLVVGWGKTLTFNNGPSCLHVLPLFWLVLVWLVLLDYSSLSVGVAFLKQISKINIKKEVNFYWNRNFLSDWLLFCFYLVDFSTVFVVLILCVSFLVECIFILFSNHSFVLLCK